MKITIYLTILSALIVTACTPAAQSITASPEDVPETNVDILANLPPVNCDTGLTPQNQEGPYFKEGSPENSILYEAGMQGKRLILAGQVLNEDCLPIPGVKVDFWQVDADGNYDNEGFTLRGHQFTDNKGRYYLETVYPGVYASRPIRHIHVKVTSPSGAVLTTQLYFPDQPVEGLTVLLEDRGDYYLGFFNFVVQN